MSTFQNIKLICTMISKLKAQELTEQLGWDFPDISDAETNLVISKTKEIEEILKNRGLGGVHGPVRSGSQDQDGNWIEFIALTQTVNKEAPKLRDILNEISRTFKIEKVDKEKISVIGVYDEKSPDLIKTAEYFIGPEHIYAVNLNKKKIMKLKGRQTGGASESEEGGIIGFDAEAVSNMETIIHELVHLKLPDEMSQIAGVSIAEASIDDISKGIVEEIKKQEYYDDFLNDPRIEEERKNILEAFELVNADLAYLINNT